LTRRRSPNCAPCSAQPGSPAGPRRSAAIDSTPDGVPAIGEAKEVPGFVLASGFSGHGFGIGPGAGHLIADVVTGAKPIFDPTPFRPERFNKSAWSKVADL
jgi:glycine/D-amino acid oxidase-like deaminating enzyme